MCCRGGHIEAGSVNGHLLLSPPLLKRGGTSNTPTHLHGCGGGGEDEWEKCLLLRLRALKWAKFIQSSSPVWNLQADLLLRVNSVSHIDRVCNSVLPFAGEDDETGRREILHFSMIVNEWITLLSVGDQCSLCQPNV